MVYAVFLLGPDCSDALSVVMINYLAYLSDCTRGWAHDRLMTFIIRRVEAIPMRPKISKSNTNNKQGNLANDCQYEVLSTFILPESTNLLQKVKSAVIKS